VKALAAIALLIAGCSELVVQAPTVACPGVAVFALQDSQRYTDSLGVRAMAGIARECPEGYTVLRAYDVPIQVDEWRYSSTYFEVIDRPEAVITYRTISYRCTE
jgi:hypothetical protein